MILLVEIIFIIFMLTLMFIGIWGFILMMKIYNQFKYGNYILEKMSQNVYMLTSKIHEVDDNIIRTHKDDIIIKDELKEVVSIHSV